MTLASKAKAVEHSPHYETVKKWYDKGLWGIARVRRAVVCKWITADEFKEIAGEEYVEA